MPIVEKQVIAPGTYWVRGPSGKPRRVDFTAEDVQHYHDSGKEMIAAGLPIRLPLEHQSWADPLDDDERKAKEVLYNRGFVKDYSIKADGSLWSSLDVPDAKFAKKLDTEIRYVSPRILPEFTDGTGRQWENVIAHVALTPQPVWHGQKPFGSEAGPNVVSLSLGEYRKTFREPIHLSMVNRDESQESIDMAVATLAKPLGPTHPINQYRSRVRPHLFRGQSRAVSTVLNAPAGHASPGGFHKQMRDFHNNVAAYHSSEGRHEDADAHKAAAEHHHARIKSSADMSGRVKPGRTAKDLSTGDKTMKQTPAEEEVEKRTEGDEEEAGESGEPTPADHFGNAKKMLKAHAGVHLPDHADHESGWEHLCTALKNKHDGKEEDEDPEAQKEADKNAREEPMMVSMSQLSDVQKRLSRAEKRAETAEKRAAESELSGYRQRIDGYVRMGWVPATKATGWMNTLAAKQLSLATGEHDASVLKVLAQMEMVGELHAGEEIRSLTEQRTHELSLAREEGQPAWGFKTEDDGVKGQEDAAKIMTEMNNRRAV